MANFNTHLFTGAVVGTSYGALAHFLFEIPLQASILTAGLTTVSSLLPDLDSDNGVILRESLGFVSVMTPMLLLDRFQSLGWSNETIVLLSCLTYIFVRFGLGEFLKRFTVHRGMWHSIPAACILGMLIYYSCNCENETIRLFKTGGAVLGFVWHLLLDEIFAFETTMGRLRVKKSFGTALKMWGNDTLANLATYGALVGAVFLVAMNPPQEHLQRHVRSANESTPTWQPSPLLQSEDNRLPDRLDVAPFPSVNVERVSRDLGH